MMKMNGEYRAEWSY